MADFITFDDRQLKKFERDLKLFANKAYPFATRQTLNDAAFTARKFTQLNIQNDLITRNPFTVRSIQVERARGLNVDRQQSEVGSIAPYFPIIEFGGTETSPGKEGLAIPTAIGAGETKGARPIRKAPSRTKRFSNLKLTRGKRKPKNRKQATLFAVQDAVQGGKSKRTIFLDLGKTKGIFRVVGGRKRAKGPKTGWPKGAKLEMLFDMSHRTVNIPAHPVMGPAVDDVVKLMPNFYRSALIKQLKRQSLFNG